MHPKPDYGSTTAVFAYVRSKVTPTMLWSAIGTLITALVVGISWIVTLQSNMHQFADRDAERQKAMGDTQQKLEILQDIRTQIAVLGEKVDGIADEVDRQREWRENIEHVANSPPHARRRK